MDVRIRQRKGPSFQNTDQQIRQAASLRIRGSFALREEVIAELPEMYRKVLMSMPPGKQEQILSAIEKKIDRKISSGAMSVAAAKLDMSDQVNFQRGSFPKQTEARKQAIAQKYRIPSRHASVKINPEMFSPQDIPWSGEYDPGTWKSDLSGVPPDVRKRMIQKRLSQHQATQIQPGQEKASPSRYMRNMSAQQAAEDIDILTESDKTEFENPKVIPTEIRKQKQRQEEGKQVQRRPDPRAGPTANNISIQNDMIENNISQTNDILPEVGTESYEQFLMSSVKTRAQKAEIQKALQKTVSGKPTKDTQRVLQKAALQAAYTQRNASGIYQGILAQAGFGGKGEKAAVQLAYQKQVRKVLKNEYRKQLTEKLSKLKTTSVMKKVQMQKARQEQFQEDEQNRAQSDQFRQSFGLMSKGTKMLKKLAENARKAIKALLTKQLPLMIIPVLMAVIIPLLATLLPLFSALTAASYQDNEVYAYADATELIEYAKSWIGKIPYVWGGGHGGGPTAWQSGCDCSGFVHGVFNHFGYEIGGDTGAMET